MTEICFFITGTEQKSGSELAEIKVRKRGEFYHTFLYPTAKTSVISRAKKINGREVTVDLTYGGTKTTDFSFKVSQKFAKILEYLSRNKTPYKYIFYLYKNSASVYELQSDIYAEVWIKDKKVFEIRAEFIDFLKERFNTVQDERKKQQYFIFAAHVLLICKEFTLTSTDFISALDMISELANNFTRKNS